MKNGTYVFILRNFRHKTTEFTIFRNGTYDIDEPEYLYYYQLKFTPPPPSSWVYIRQWASFRLDTNQNASAPSDSSRGSLRQAKLLSWG